jgi:Spore coat assembly protein
MVVVQGSVRISIGVLFGFLLGFLPLRADLIISEFAASNDTTLKDDFFEDSDWIEIHNTGSSFVNLQGWRLTDDPNNLAKWTFPARVLPPGGYLVVFASGRDRKVTDAPLHTNFSLSAEGEFLTLVRPDGSIASSYAPRYPRQVPDVSYGIPQSRTTPAITRGHTGQVGVPVSEQDYAANFANWTTAMEDFTGSSWQAVETGVGFVADGTDYGGNIAPGGDIRERMVWKQRSACLRLKFHVEAPDNIAFLRLRMKFDDGFIAYINGTEVASVSAPASPVWNSTATVGRDSSLNAEWVDFTIPISSIDLRAGENLLAIHGFNVRPESPEFLLLPELYITEYADGPAGYFTSPTPGELNGSAITLGPVLSEATNWIPRPLGNASSPPEVVTVKVEPTVHAVATDSVRLFYITMFNDETEVWMRDDGVAPDTRAGDGVYTAILPTTDPTAGLMFRWRFEAKDVQGNIGRAPVFHDPEDNDRYYGTVARDPSENFSQLPILHLFAADSGGAGTRGGARGSVFFLDRFYDNITINLHGQSTSTFAKSSRNLDFNRDNRFAWAGTATRRLKDVDLLTNYADKTRTRNTLAHEVHKLALGTHHFAFPVRVHQNAEFHGVMDMVENGDSRMLERNGLDPNGALYKIYDRLESTASASKKTRKLEDTSDLQSLIDALNPATHSLAARRLWAYDNLDIPATVNYLAARALISDRDHGHKNYYVYHDTFRTGQWRPIAWDVDLSFGHHFTSADGYFNDDIVANDPIRPAGATSNRLYRIIAETPEFRAMFLRRLRTLMDTILGPPGTVDGLLERRMREIVASIDPDPGPPDPAHPTDGDLDFDKWGTWGRGLRPREEAEYVIAHYFEPRRTFLYNQDPATRPHFSTSTSSGDPIPDQPQTNTSGMVQIDSVDHSPASGNSAEQYLILRNTTSHAVDISGWRLEGAVSHTFPGGTVIPPGAGTPAAGYAGLLHVTRNAIAFRHRTSGPTGGEGRLVQGNFSGDLPATGGTIHLRDEHGQTISSFTYTGETTPRLSLRLTEIQYHPAPPGPAESAALPDVVEGDFEYLVLRNFGSAPLDLSGIRFTVGITFTFSDLILPPDGRVVLAKRPAAFKLRYPASDAMITGPFGGSLDNAGERLVLVDASGETILDFSYKDGWYPATDGSGRSLVARRPASNPDLSKSTSWRISRDPLGSGGKADPDPAIAYHGWDNFHFTSSERDIPSISGLSADPDRDGRSNWLEYAQGTNPRVHDTARVEILWMDDGGGSAPAIRFDRPKNALDVTYELEVSRDLVFWKPVSFTPHSVDPNEEDSEIETVTVRPTHENFATPNGFYRIRVIPLL